MTTSQALRVTRNESGKSQEFMAFELGVNRRTIQNWESGVSEPSVGQAIRWFKLVDKNPIPYLLQGIYPEMDRISYKDDDVKILTSLLKIISDLPAEEVRQLMYLFFGNHGSSPRGVLQMVTAHLQTPMKDRISQGQLIATNYEIAKRTGSLARPDNIQPDLIFLNAAIAAAKEAVERDAKEYCVEVEKRKNSEN